MKIYVVGGSIRDKLLGLDVKDMDYVVVGSTPEELLSKGFRPVGKDFPVFLHPKTRQEYALARTERKSAPGYHGFTFHASPEVTLEEDLRRRDLTINAMAEDENGKIIDLFGGRDDLRNGILRHVSPAFAEDPVRILRVARFAARFPDFVVEKTTMELMRQMVKAGEVDALVSERVWQEISRGLMEICPSKMFETLRECGALEKLIPELNALWGVAQSELHHPEIDAGIHVMMALDYSAEQKFSLPVRFSVLFHDLGKGITPPEILPKHSGHEERGVPLVENICARLRIPHDCRDLAIITAREHGNILKSAELSPEKTLDLLQRCDALRRPERFAELLQASECDFRGRGKDKAQFRTAHFPQKTFWEKALSAAQSVPAGKIAQENKDFPQKIPNAIREERIIAISRSFVSSSMKNGA